MPLLLELFKKKNSIHLTSNVSNQHYQYHFISISTIYEISFNSELKISAFSKHYSKLEHSGRSMDSQSSNDLIRSNTFYKPAWRNTINAKLIRFSKKICKYYMRANLKLLESDWHMLYYCGAKKTVVDISSSEFQIKMILTI